MKVKLWVCAIDDSEGKTRTLVDERDTVSYYADKHLIEEFYIHGKQMHAQLSSVVVNDGWVDVYFMEVGIYRNTCIQMTEEQNESNRNTTGNIT